VSPYSDTSVATISITQHASASLGDVVFVEGPQVRKDIKAGGAYLSRSRVMWLLKSPLRHPDQIGAVETVKAAADIVHV
jgi:glycine cleavage system H lipoate-binding protein